MIGGFIAGRGRGADYLAVPVAVGDPFPVVVGGAGYPSMLIAVGGIAAAWRCRADNMSFGGAERDLGAVPEGGADDFPGGIAVSGNAAVRGGGAYERTVGIEVIDRGRKKRNSKQQQLNHQQFFHSYPPGLPNNVASVIKKSSFQRKNASKKRTTR